MRDRFHICNRPNTTSTSGRAPACSIRSLKKKKKKIAMPPKPSTDKDHCSPHVIAEVRIQVAKAKGGKGWTKREEEQDGCSDISYENGKEIEWKYTRASCLLTSRRNRHAAQRKVKNSENVHEKPNAKSVRCFRKCASRLFTLPAWEKRVYRYEQITCLAALQDAILLRVLAELYVSSIDPERR